MRYLVCRRQKAEGCDYTIGCGMAYEWYNIDGTFDEAKAAILKDVLYPEYGQDGEFQLQGETDLCELWIILADDAVEIDLEDLRCKHLAGEQNRQEVDEEAHDRKEYERLKAKFA